MKILLLFFVTIFLFQTAAFSQTENLDSFHDCWSSTFETEQEGITGGLSFLTPTRSECRDGMAVLVIKKFPENLHNRAQFVVTDTLKVQTKCPEGCLYITRCEDIGGNTKQYILLINSKSLSGKVFTKFKKAWTYNDNLEFTDSSDKELTCVNQDYGA
ncbi:MAG: hypothetical protein JJU37_05795 [Balneolaceae bacterium]|nr:hypothetical protein [Balneolaceae bacterium]